MNFSAWFYSLRPKQWIKNGFILLPLIFGAKLFSFPDNLRTILGIAIFSLAAGAVYLINDLMDLEGDRLHPLKRLRPLASGKIPKQQVSMAAVPLMVLSIFLSLMLEANFGFLVVFYVVLNLIYSKFLKNLVIIDVFCIGLFFLIRVLAGCFLARVEISHWILFMTVLLALFLGFNKRRQELKMMGKEAGSHRVVLAKYNAYFIDQMIAVVTSSIVVAYMLYTVDGRTVERFGSNHLMFTIPFVYYGLFRYLYLLQKNHKDGDPSRIFLSDRPMQWNVVAWLTVAVAVIYFY